MPYRRDTLFAGGGGGLGGVVGAVRHECTATEFADRNGSNAAVRWTHAGDVQRRVDGAAPGITPALRGFRSDGAFMDVAPARACVALQWAGDGVVGLFVVGSSVLVW